jgi:hypothetical protein
MRYTFFTILALACLQGCINRPSAPARKLHDKEFNWSIELPKGFESLDSDQYAKLQQKGTQAVQKTMGQTIVNNSKVIFAFRSDRLHYFEANKQPFDTTTDGDYLTTNKQVDDVLYNTFKQQMPGMQIDTTISTETIDKLVFQRLNVRIKLDSKNSMNLFMYNRLFGKKELTISIMYVDSTKGAALLNAWRHSTFGN